MQLLGQLGSANIGPAKPPQTTKLFNLRLNRGSRNRDGAPPPAESTRPLRSSVPVDADFVAPDLTIGCGVAIFHLASERVVICYHTRHKYYFLPKGRKDVGEDMGRAAEREGFEESGYRNRLLPLPYPHGQTSAAGDTSPFSTEPVWTQMLTYSPASRRQYLLFWYLAETLPPDLASVEGPHTPAPAYPRHLKLVDRIAQEPKDWEPPRHEGTGMDAEELQYTSGLVTLSEAMTLLPTIQADVVKRGWEAIQDRMSMERV